MDACGVGLADLPLDVLLNIFSLLPLRTILKFEHQCHSLQKAVEAHLSLIECFNLYDSGVLYDKFVRFESPPVALGDGRAARLLARCPRVVSVAYLPAESPGINVPALLDLFRRQTVARLLLCDNWALAHALLGRGEGERHQLIRIDQLRLQGSPERIRLPPNCPVRRLDLSGLTLEGGLPSLNETEEIELSRVTLVAPPVVEEGAVVGFARLRSFAFNGATFASDAAQLRLSTVSLLTSLAMAPNLEFLRITVGGFDELRDVCRVGGFPRLAHLELGCSVWYESSSPQLSNDASVVAELCALSASTLRRLCLPPVVLVKQFFVFFLTRETWFPNLETLDVSGNVYDTTFFLPPFDMADGYIYDAFIQRCPQLASLSLHSYSGSLKPDVLHFPVHLTRLTLPWDSRHPLAASWADIAAVVGALPGLTDLHIAGVESVEGVSVAAQQRTKGAPVIKLQSAALEVVRISNVCCSKIDLVGCTRLTRFALQCCPVLTAMRLPAATLESISIYDEGRQYMMKFIESYLSQPMRKPGCSIHIQLHSVWKSNSDLPSEKGKKLVPEVNGVLMGFSRSLDYVMLHRYARKELHHSRREPMFACTEFQPEPEFHPGSGTAEEIAKENSHRLLVAEGIHRWLRYLTGCQVPARDFQSLKGHQVSSAKDPKLLNITERVEFQAQFCGQLFNCYTNISDLADTSASPFLMQPSCSSNGADVKALSVPRPSSTATHITTPHRKPVVCISVMEYLHYVSLG